MLMLMLRLLLHVVVVVVVVAVVVTKRGVGYLGDCYSTPAPTATTNYCGSYEGRGEPHAQFVPRWAIIE